MKRESEAPSDRYIEIDLSHAHVTPAATHGFKTVSPPARPSKVQAAPVVPLTICSAQNPGLHPYAS